MLSTKTVLDLITLVRSAVDTVASPATILAPTRLVEVLSELEAVAADLGFAVPPEGAPAPLPFKDVEHIREQERAAVEASRQARVTAKP